MKKIIFIVCLVFAVFVAAEQDVYQGPSEEDVIVLDNSNLQSTIYESEDTWLLEFYAPWCGHCKTLRPQWAKLATKLKGVVKVAKIDASVNRQFDQTYNLKGYPHVILIPAGPKDKSIYYTHEGGRTADSIEQWALQKIKANKGFLVQRLTNEQKWNQNCLGIQVPLCVIAFLPTLQDSSQQERSVYLQTMKGVVNGFRDKPVSFMWSQAGDHKQLQDQFNLNSGFPAVILINPIRRVFSIMRSSFTEQNFSQWLKDILNRKGGRKFGQYSKSLVFGDVSDDSSTSGVIQDNIEIKQDANQEFAQQL